MKNKTPKPRVMWANYYPDTGNLSFHNENRHAKRWSRDGSKPFRVAVIPLSDVETIVERAILVYWANGAYDSNTAIRAVLTAAGIPCKRKARK